MPGESMVWTRHCADSLGSALKLGCETNVDGEKTGMMGSASGWSSHGPSLGVGASMNWSIRVLKSTVLALLAALSSCAGPLPRAGTAGQASPVTEEVRKELLEARETAWRSFVGKDASAVEGILAPELIAIQESSGKWEDRASLLSLAREMSERGVEIRRLEFPRTQIQLFGNTAILYYTYIFETGLGARSGVSAGRGTEVFVHRGGKWVDVGWHLDNGPFQRKDGQWVRAGEPYPEPSQSPSPQGRR